MLVAERFIASLINKYGKHPVSTDGGTRYSQACRFLKQTSFAFPIGKKIDRKDDAVHQGGDREFWWLLSMPKKEMQTKACKTMVESICLLPQ